MWLQTPLGTIQSAMSGVKVNQDNNYWKNYRWHNRQNLNVRKGTSLTRLMTFS